MTAHAATSEAVPPAEETRHRLAAFGLEVESDWALPGSTPISASEPRPSPTTTVDRLSPPQMESEWAQPAELVFQPDYPDGRTRVTVERTDSHYRLWFDGFGRYLVSEDGSAVGCEQGGFTQDRQERLVFAQALPLAAALQGLELLHASAVTAGDGVVAFVGPSGAGKTTLASRLVMRGAGLVTDDVLALERGPHAPLAHPGPPMMVIRPEDQPATQGSGRLGPAVGSSDKVHVSVATVDGPLPLRALYYLEQGDTIEITQTEQADLRRALGSVFAPYLTTRGRLQRHLEAVRQLSGSVRQYRLQIPRTGRLDDALDAVEAHLRAAGVH